ncbi:MAG: hypothetical protein ACJ78Q_14350 [Chloroflexia bacterium]
MVKLILEGSNSSERLAGSTLAASRVRPALVVAVCSAAAALLVRATLLWTMPFDGLYGQDAFYYQSATNTLIDTWTDPSRLARWLTSWGAPPISVWPLGYHLQSALAALILGRGPTSGQAVSLLAGTLTAAWTALLTLRISHLGVMGPEERNAVPSNSGSLATRYSLLATRYPVLPGALLAGLIIAVSALAVRSSVVVMADMAGLQWATLGALLALLYLDVGVRSAKLGLLTGVCIGLASLTRYIYPLLLLPVLGAVVLAWKRRGVGDSAGRLPLVGAMLAILLPALLIFAPQVAHNFIHPMQSVLPSPVIASWSPQHAWQGSFDGPDGHLEYRWPMALFYLVLPLLSAHAVGLAFAPFLLLGLVWILRTPTQVAAVLVVGWWLCFAGFYSGNIYQADRFVLSFLPPLAVLAGLGLNRFIAFVLPGVRTGASANPEPSRRFLMPGFLAIVAIPVLISLAGLVAALNSAVADYLTLYTGKQDYLQAVHCVQDVASESRTGLPLLTFQITFAMRQYTTLDAHELYAETPNSVDALLNRSPANGAARGYLVLPLAGFETQWGHTQVGRTYQHLQTAYQLDTLPCPGTSFTTFEIRSR